MRRFLTLGWTAVLAFVASSSITTHALAQQDDVLKAYKSIQWVVGPGTGDLGNATIKVPAGYRFTDAAGAEAFLRYSGNVYSGDVGIMEPVPVGGKEPPYFIVFSFNDEGYIKDDEKDKLDDSFAADTLKQFQEGQKEANKGRAAQGLSELTISGWSQKPFFDDQTKNLTWGLIVSSPRGSSVNYESRVLGRRGYMNVNMVLDEADVAKSVPEYRKLIAGLAYKSGDSYAEFRDGDKVAKYGLLGLASGGLAIAAVKWWKPLMKFGIFIVAGVALAIKKVFSMFKSKAAPTA